MLFTYCTSNRSWKLIQVTTSLAMLGLISVLNFLSNCEDRHLLVWQAPLGVRSAKHRHQSPQCTASFRERLLDFRSYPCSTRASWTFVFCQFSSSPRDAASDAITSSEGTRSSSSSASRATSAAKSRSGNDTIVRPWSCWLSNHSAETTTATHTVTISEIEFIPTEAEKNNTTYDVYNLF